MLAERIVDAVNRMAARKIPFREQVERVEGMLAEEKLVPQWCPNTGRLSEQEAESQKMPMCRGSAGRCWGRATAADGLCTRHVTLKYHKLGSKEGCCAGVQR